jgi:uncharacterized protein YjgD (DUF1641 family)
MPETDVTPEPVEVESTDTSATEKQTTQDQTVKQWYDSFSDETLRKDESIKKYKSFDEFGKAFKEKDSMIGRKGVILPKETDPNDINRFYNDLGRPKESSEYKNPEIQVEDALKGFYSEDRLNNFKQIAHKHGLTQKQYEGIAKEFTENQLNEVRNIVSSENKKIEESTRALMNEWLVDYDANTKQAEMALRSFAKGISQEKIDALLSDPDIKKLGFNIAKSVSEDSYRKGDGRQVETVQSLQSFIDSQVKVMNSSYYNQHAPDHKAAREKVKEAYELLADMRKGDK